MVSFFCGLSLFTLTAISVDRLLALMLGLRYNKHVLIVMLWLVYNCLCNFNLFFNFPVGDYVIWTIILLCLITSTLCYTKIYLALRQHQAQLQGHIDQRHPNGGRSPLNIARYKKTVSSALWGQIILVACYLPFGIRVAMFAITRLNTPSMVLSWEASLVVLMFNSTELNCTELTVTELHFLYKIKVLKLFFA